MVGISPVRSLPFKLRLLVQCVWVVHVLGGGGGGGGHRANDHTTVTHIHNSDNTVTRHNIHKHQRCCNAQQVGEKSQCGRYASDQAIVSKVERPEGERHTDAVVTREGCTGSSGGTTVTTLSELLAVVKPGKLARTASQSGLQGSLGFLPTIGSRKGLGHCKP
jgi:hypothetical protein